MKRVNVVEEENDQLKNDLKDKYDDEQQDNKYPWEKCNFAFECKAGYETHLQGIQRNTFAIDISFDEEEEDSDNEEFQEKCYFCQKTFLSYDTLEDHQSNHIRCEKCVVCYHNEFEYEKHEDCDN